MEYDPTQYAGSAPHYLVGRPPYSAELEAVLADELGLDGSGRMLDVGCGPGVLAVRLAGLVDSVTALDPDADMLDQARRHAAASGLHRIEFIHARAEDIPRLGLAPMRLVTFGHPGTAADVENVVSVREAGRVEHGVGPLAEKGGDEEGLIDLGRGISDLPRTCCITLVHVNNVIHVGDRGQRENRTRRSVVGRSWWNHGQLPAVLPRCPSFGDSR